MKILVVIVTYNADIWITSCFDSLIESSVLLDIMVIDNGSTDNTIKRLEQDYPQVELIKSKENLGFAKANNIGLKKAYENNVDYVFLLNQDAWVEPNTIEQLIEVHSCNQDFGVLSPIHLNGQGDKLDWNFTHYISAPEDEGRRLYSDLLRQEKLKAVYEVDFVNAAAWLISRECLKKVGVFNEVIFQHYGEDNNYLQRVTFHGHKVGVVPSVFIYHDREERQGGAVKNTFTLDTKILKFKINGSDITNDQGPIWMQKEIKATFRQSLKELLKFNLREFRGLWMLQKEMKSLYNLIIDQRIINANRYE